MTTTLSIQEVFTKLSVQEIFTKVATHLLTQNVQSIGINLRLPKYNEDTMLGDNKICYYRSNEGLKCAIGCLIDDDAYDIWLEGCTINDSAVVKALQQSGIAIKRCGTMYTMLDHLQNVHDNHEPKDWEIHLKAIARYYSLAMPTIEH